MKPHKLIDYFKMFKPKRYSVRKVFASFVSALFGLQIATHLSADAATDKKVEQSKVTQNSKQQDMLSTPDYTYSVEKSGKGHTLTGQTEPNAKVYYEANGKKVSTQADKKGNFEINNVPKSAGASVIVRKENGEKSNSNDTSASNNQKSSQSSAKQSDKDKQSDSKKTNNEKDSKAADQSQSIELKQSDKYQWKYSNSQNNNNINNNESTGTLVNNDAVTEKNVEDSQAKKQDKKKKSTQKKLKNNKDAKKERSLKNVSGLNSVDFKKRTVKDDEKLKSMKSKAPLSDPNINSPLMRVQAVMSSAYLTKERAPEVVDSHIDITLSEVKDTGYYEPQSGEMDGVGDGIVKPLSGEGISYHALLQIDDYVHEGDIFNFKYSSNTLPYNINHTAWEPSHLTDKEGNTIASATYHADDNVISYAFTDYIEQHKNVSADLKVDAYIDRETVTRNGTVNIAFSLGEHSDHSTLYVEYPLPIRQQSANIMSHINGYDDRTSMVEQLIYINPYKLKNDEPGVLEIINRPLNITYDRLQKKHVTFFREREPINLDNSMIDIFKTNGKSIPSSLQLNDFSHYERLAADSPLTSYLDTTNGLKVMFKDLNDAYIVRVSNPVKMEEIVNGILQSAVLITEKSSNPDGSSQVAKAISSNIIELDKKDGKTIRTSLSNWEPDREYKRIFDESLLAERLQEAQIEQSLTEPPKVYVTLSDKEGRLITSITTNDENILKMYDTYNDKYTLEFLEPLPEEIITTNGFIEFMNPGKRPVVFGQNNQVIDMDELSTDNLVEDISEFIPDTQKTEATVEETPVKESTVTEEIIEDTSTDEIADSEVSIEEPEAEEKVEETSVEKESTAEKVTTGEVATTEEVAEDPIIEEPETEDTIEEPTFEEESTVEDTTGEGAANEESVEAPIIEEPVSEDQLEDSISENEQSETPPLTTSSDEEELQNKVMHVILKSSTGEVVATTIPDEDGNYDFDVEPGEYSVEYQLLPEGEVIEPTPAKQISNNEVKVVSVKDANGQIHTTIVEPDGSFEFEGLAPGEYTIYFNTDEGIISMPFEIKE